MDRYDSAEIRLKGKYHTLSLKLPEYVQVDALYMEKDNRLWRIPEPIRVSSNKTIRTSITHYNAIQQFCLTSYTTVKIILFQILTVTWKNKTKKTRNDNINCHCSALHTPGTESGVKSRKCLSVKFHWSLQCSLRGCRSSVSDSCLKCCRCRCVLNSSFRRVIALTTVLAITP